MRGGNHRNINNRDLMYEAAESIEEEFDFDDMMSKAVEDLEFLYKPQIFRSTALKNFLSRSLAEMNPDLSLQGNTIEYYSELFTRYIFDRAVFAYWKIKNDKVDF